jgi:TfoX/Sxy family transcriptional regulator of competence genes
MAYDEKLAVRIRGILKGRKGVTEKKMFGGVAFLLQDKMFVGIQKDELMARVGPEAHNQAVSQKHARPMDFTGKPMVGFIYVKPAGFKTKAMLEKWVGWCENYVKTLQKKKPKK